MSTSTVPVAIGDVIAGKYVIEKVIGAGGVGVVMAARHEGLGEQVAIKFLQPAAAKAKETSLRFDLEARALARVKTEHVARVMDVGRLPTGEPFMVMELLLGEDLSRVIARGRTPVRAAVDHLVQACEAVAAAHAVSIVHRDLKPANLFVTAPAKGKPSVIKVLDFGISKFRNEAHAVTQTLSVVGSPLYMAPEQMESPRDADERADIWSLAVILFELIAAAPPFEAPTLPLLCARICTASPRSFDEVGVRVPHALARIIRQCLEKRPDDRPPSVIQLAEALAPFGGEASRESLRRLLRAQQPADVEAFDPAPPSDAPLRSASVRPGIAAAVVDTHTPKRKPFRITAVTFAVLMLAFFGGGVFVTQSGAQRGESAGTGVHARAFLAVYLLRVNLQSTEIADAEPARVEPVTTSIPITSPAPKDLEVQDPTASPSETSRPRKARPGGAGPARSPGNGRQLGGKPIPPATSPQPVIDVLSER